MVKRKGKICAFVKISVPGGTFVAMGDAYRHIRGAYCLPEHRGKGFLEKGEFGVRINSEWIWNSVVDETLNRTGLPAPECQPHSWKFFIL